MSFLDNIKFNPEKQTATFKYRFGDDYGEQGKTFFSIYDHKSFLIITDATKSKLKPKKERVCRFCGKSSPDVTFKNKAHLIPQLLGNKNLLSDFECDTCNRNFGDFENEFANFIGLTRTLTSLTGKEGIPKFKSPDKEFSLWINDEDGISYDEKEKSKNVIWDKENNLITIKTKGNPYNRLMVLKCLVKIGLSIIDENEKEYFNESFNFLNNSKIEVFEHTLSSIHEYVIPGPFVNFPMIFSYKKKDEVKDDLIPTRTFVLYYRNNMIQFFIPFDKRDKLINDNKDSIAKVAILPPLVDQKWIDKYAKPSSELINLKRNSKEKNRDEIVKIKLE
jgi:hypothetical protein